MLGCNTRGQLGLGSGKVNLQAEPVLLEIDTSKIEAIALGSAFTVVLENGGIKICGSSDSCLLESDTFSFKKLESEASQSTLLTCGVNNAIYYRKEQALVAFGSNIASQFGTATNSEKILNTPKVVLNEYFVKQIALGERHCIFLTNGGKVFGSGDNSCWQLSDSAPKKATTFVAILNEAGVTSVHCTLQSSIICKKNSVVMSCGEGRFGTLGNASFKNEKNFKTVLQVKNIRKIATGCHHVLALSESGQITAWGHNEYGQLGNGGNENVSKPFTLKIEQKVKSVACGAFHSLYLTESGDLFTFGNNQFFQCGFSDVKFQSVPRFLLKDETISILMSGFVDNNQQQTQTPGETPSSETPYGETTSLATPSGPTDPSANTNTSGKDEKSCTIF